MCNVTTFPSQDIIFDSQQNKWIKVICRNKMKAKGRDKSPSSNAIVCAIKRSEDQHAKTSKSQTFEHEGTQASSQL
jgi:hypothetical protein